MAISYLLSFLFIRISVLIAGSVNNEYTNAIKEGSLNSNFYIGKNIIIFGYHIHHFYFGIFLICIAGWLAIMGNTYLSKNKLAVIYGTGLGLFMDEIGLLLTEGNYFSSLSYLLGVFLLGIFFNIIYFPSFWKNVRTQLVNNSFTAISFFNNIFKSLISLLDKLSSLILKNKKIILILLLILLILDYVFSLLFPLILK